MRTKTTLLLLLLILLLTQPTIADLTLADQSPARLYNITLANNTVYNQTGAYYEFNGNIGAGGRDALYTSTNLVRDGIITNQFTLSAWLRFDQQNSSSVQTIAGQIKATGVGGDSFGMYITGTGNGSITARVDNSTAQGTKTGGVAIKSIWYHALTIYNGTHLCMYVNGVFASPCATTVTGRINNNSNVTNDNFTIGGRPRSVSSLSFNGSIDDVRIWKTALTNNQAAAAYSNESVGCDNLVGYYPFLNATTSCAASCTYPGSGNWQLHAADTCSVSTNTNVLNNNITCIGNGTATFTGSITNYTLISAGTTCAMTFTNQTVPAATLNASGNRLQLSSSMTLGRFDLNNQVITLYNASYDTTSATVLVRFVNLTTPNALTTLADFPNVTSVVENTVLLTNELSQTVNATITFNTQGTEPYNPLLSHPDGSTESLAYGYDGTSMTFNALLQDGQSTLTLDTRDLSPEAATACTDSLTGILRGFTRLVAIIVGVLLLVLVVGFAQYGEFNEAAIKVLLGAGASLLIALVSIAVTMGATCT